MGFSVGCRKIVNPVRRGQASFKLIENILGCDTAQCFVKAWFAERGRGPADADVAADVKRVVELRFWNWNHKANTWFRTAVSGVKGEPVTCVSVPSVAIAKTWIEPVLLLALLVTMRNLPSAAPAADTGLAPTAYGEPLSSVNCPVALFNANAETLLEVRF